VQSKCVVGWSPADRAVKGVRDGVLIFGVPAAVVLGLVRAPRAWRLGVLWLVWFVCLATQTAYLAHPGRKGFFGVEGWTPSRAGRWCTG
jgi:hypothetical protein